MSDFLRYVNSNGDSVELSLNSNLILANFSDEMDANFYTSKNALEDGEVMEGNDLNPRYITIRGKYLTNASYKDLEKRLRKIFNPKIGGTLYRTYGNETRQIDVQVENIPTFEYDNKVGYVDISLIGYGSYWQKSKVTEQLAYLTPKFVFPQTFIGGAIFGLKSSQLVSIINNIGDVDCGYIINLKATSGTVTGPFIQNNKTGQAIKFNASMAQNDTITIDYMSPQPIIYLNGVKDFTILNALDSEFFKLLVGDNELEYNAETNVSNLTVTLIYAPLML